MMTKTNNLKTIGPEQENSIEIGAQKLVVANRGSLLNTGKHNSFKWRCGVSIQDLIR